MRLGVDGRFEDGRKDVEQHLLKVVERAVGVVQVVEAWDLDEPTVMGRVELVINDPVRELVPLSARPSTLGRRVGAREEEEDDDRDDDDEGCPRLP